MTMQSDPLLIQAIQNERLREAALQRRPLAVLPARGDPPASRTAAARFAAVLGLLARHIRPAEGRAKIPPHDASPRRTADRGGAGDGENALGGDVRVLHDRLRRSHRGAHAGAPAALAGEANDGATRHLDDASLPESPTAALGA